MPRDNFSVFQINIFCCNRRRPSETVSLASGRTDRLDILRTDISDTFSDFELVQSTTPSASVNPKLSRAKLRWVRATLAAVLRQRVVKAYNQLTRRTKHNKAIGVPDPVASRLWGQTGNWLQRHKL
jgi:hypothetical protein